MKKFKINKKNKGFSLIELMIGLTLGLIALTVMVDVISNTNQQTKQLNSNAQTQNSGAIGSYYLERDLRMAGYGIIDSSVLGCKVHGVYNNGSGDITFDLQLVPLVIQDGGSGSDKITANFGNSDAVDVVAKLSSDNNEHSANYKVDNRYGFIPGNLTVLFNPAVDFDSDGIPDCILAEITNVPGSSGQTDVVTHNNGKYTNEFGVKVDASYNPPGGVANALGIADPNYSKGTMLLNLGSMPTSVTYEVDANNYFKKTDNYKGTTEEIASDVVLLKAYYMKDSNGDGAVDTIDKITPTNAAEWNSVLGVKFVMVAKTKTIMEDPMTRVLLFSKQTLPSGDVFNEVYYDVPTSDQNYLHKVYQQDVPLRNMLWRNK